LTLYSKYSQCYKRLFISFILLSSVEVTRAQLLIGPKGGVQATTTLQDEKNPELDMKAKLGWNLGVRTEFIFNHNLSLHSELFYSRKGKKVDLLGESLTHETTYNHIDLPITVKYTFRAQGSQPSQEFYLRAGGFFSYWLSGNGVISGNAASQEYDISFDEGENSLTTIHLPDANRLQAGFNFAAGMMFTLLPDQFLVAEIDANISHSFLSEQTEVIYPVFGFQDNLRSRNLVIALNVSYLFGFDLVKNDKAPKESSKGKAPKVRKKKMNKKKLEKKSLKYINRRNIKIYGN